MPHTVKRTALNFLTGVHFLQPAGPASLTRCGAGIITGPDMFPQSATPTVGRYKSGRQISRVSASVS
jgi:hypothetical protein